MRTYYFLGTNLSAALSRLSLEIEILFLAGFFARTANYASVPVTSTELALSPKELVLATT